MSRSDKEYILMGRIMEKETELAELRKELENAEIERMSGITSFEFMPVTPEDVHEIPEITVPPSVDVSGSSSAHPYPVKKADEHPDPPEVTHHRKIISIDKVLKLVDGDQTLASDIAAGKYTSVKWGSRNYVPAWCNGRKYDPTNGRISNLRNELRRAPRSIRSLSSVTGLAIDTVKDLVREMDKQGFFTN
jgi:hypothetical protein